jgi:hypothetical protein
MEVVGAPALDQPLGETYPGDDEVGRQAEEVCLSAFEEFVGVDYDNSRLDVTYYAPSPETWACGDRRIVCVVEATQAAPLTRSVQGSKQ